MSCLSDITADVAVGIAIRIIVSMLSHSCCAASVAAEILAGVVPYVRSFSCLAALVTVNVTAVYVVGVLSCVISLVFATLYAAEYLTVGIEYVLGYSGLSAVVTLGITVVIPGVRSCYFKSAHVTEIIAAVRSLMCRYFSCKSAFTANVTVG